MSQILKSSRLPNRSKFKQTKAQQVPLPTYNLTSNNNNNQLLLSNPNNQKSLSFAVSTNKCYY